MEKILDINTWNRALMRRSSEEYNRYERDASHPNSYLVQYLKMTKDDNMTEYSAYVSELVFDNIKADYQAHDKTCSSIPHMWMGSKGGVSCFGEQACCDHCEVTFYYEGLRQHPGIDEDGDKVEMYYCNCCERKLGLKDEE